MNLFKFEICLDVDTIDVEFVRLPELPKDFKGEELFIVKVFIDGSTYSLKDNWNEILRIGQVCGLFNFIDNQSEFIYRTL